jgi:hypothetical protein
MSTPQEYWDACLIKTWRKAGTISDMFSMYYSITKQMVSEGELLRVPSKAIHPTIGVRVFVANYLPKISDWLWDKSPEKDVVLLKKLSTSKYTTLDQRFETNADKELRNERRRLGKNRLRVAMNTIERNNRTQKTEWGVTKGADSRTGGRSRRYG